MRRRQRGFTLVELMVAVAIIGVLSAIAIPMFVGFMGRGKKVEATLGLDKMTKNLRVYHAEKGILPPSTNLMPALSACVSGTAKTPPTTQSMWFANAGWKELEFHVDEPGYFQYEWINNADGTGVAKATGDLDCDGTLGLLIIDVSILTGNVFEAITTDITD